MTADQFPSALLCRKSQCFVQLLNLLNIDYSHEAGTALCEQVLSTATALMAGNESMKSEMKKTVGYDTLLNIVLRRTAPKGPSAGVLMQVLHLILEVDPIEHLLSRSTFRLHSRSSQKYVPQISSRLSLQVQTEYDKLCMYELVC